MALRGHVFDKQLFSSDCYSLVTDVFLNKHSGVIKGCNLTNTNSSIHIDEGYFIIKGRPLQEEGGTTIEVGTGNVDGLYCILVCEIDMSQTNTTSELKQASYKIIEDTTDYPTLTQEDTTDGGIIYQFEFARFRRTLNGIEDFVDTRSFLNFDSIYTQIENEIKKIEEGSIFIKKGELDNELGKTYTGTNITAPTVAGYGRINKLYGQTIEDVNLYNETSNLQTTTQYAGLSQGTISLIAGEKYTISFDTNNNGGTVYTDEAIFTSSTTVTCDGKRKTVTLTAKDTITNSITTLIKAFVATSTAYEIKNIKVQKGSVATPYSPYGYASVEVISENGENKSSNICYVKDGLNEDDYVDYTLGKVVRADGTTEDVLDCSNKIVQYADNTNVYNTDGAEIEVNLTNSEVISDLNEQNKILEEKQRQMSNYSTKEQVVGTWINGKPLYRKFYQVTSPIVSTNGTYVYANYSVADLNTDFAFINNSWLDDSEFVFTLPYIKSSNGIIKAYFDIKNKEIELASNESTYNNKPCIVELLYTKTTD